jgi:hypothetical protein
MEQKSKNQQRDDRTWGSSEERDHDVEGKLDNETAGPDFQRFAPAVVS